MSPGCSGIPVPTQQAHSRRAALFPGPVRHVPFVVFHVKHHDAVWIGPDEFRHRGVLQDRHLIGVGRGSVVREERSVCKQKTSEQCETNAASYDIIRHLDELQIVNYQICTAEYARQFRVSIRWHSHSWLCGVCDRSCGSGSGASVKTTQARVPVPLNAPEKSWPLRRRARLRVKRDSPAAPLQPSGLSPSWKEIP